jgi:hypothetical protein
MPPDGYTTITIPEETAEKLAQLMVEHELETMSKAVKFAWQLSSKRLLQGY